MTTKIDHDQFRRVAELLARQEAALEELDLLSHRIEQAIAQHIGSREGSTEFPLEDEINDPISSAGVEKPTRDSQAA